MGFIATNVDLKPSCNCAAFRFVGSLKFVTRMQMREGIAVVTAEALWEVSTSPVLESNSRIGILHSLPDIPEENL